MEGDAWTDQKQFADLVIHCLRNNGETRPIHFDDKRFAILIEAAPDKMLIVSLNDAYKECSNFSTEQYEEIIARHVKIWTGGHNVPKDYTDALSKIGLSLRRSGFFERNPGCVHWNVTRELSVALVYDDGEALHDVYETSLVDWQVEKQVSFEDALVNLFKSGWLFEQVGHIFRSRTCDSYDAARMVFTDAFRALPLKGDPVILVPDRDCLVVTGSDDLDGLTQMAATGHVRIGSAATHFWDSAHS